MYSVAFVVIARSSPALGAELSAPLLMLSGLFGAPALVGHYQRLGPGECHQPALGGHCWPAQPDRSAGPLTFSVAGLAVLIFAWLMSQGGGFPAGLGYVGYVLAVLLMIIYLATLIRVKVTNPVLLVPALLAGFSVNPVWYIWLGVALQQDPQSRR